MFKRKPNFSEEEVQQLLTSVANHKSQVFGRFAGTPGVGGSTRAEAWAQIQREVQSHTAIVRTTDELKKKWCDLKNKAKQETARHRREQSRTGGGPPPAPLSETSKEVMSMLGEESVDGVPGGIDSSATRPSTSSEPACPLRPKKRARKEKVSPGLSKMLEVQSSILEEMRALVRAQNELNHTLQRLVSVMEHRTLTLDDRQYTSL